jgi:hypothetical protein
MQAAFTTYTMRPHLTPIHSRPASPHSTCSFWLPGFSASPLVLPLGLVAGMAVRNSWKDLMPLLERSCCLS